MVQVFPLRNTQCQHSKITLRWAWFSLPESSMAAERCFIINLLSVGEIPCFAIQVLFWIEQAQRPRGFYYVLHNKKAKADTKCCPLL